MTGFKPKRADVAGVPMDEAWRAVSNIHDAVKEIAKQGIEFNEFPETQEKIRQWLVNKPLRHGDSPDADVQQYLAQGVRNIDGLKQLMPLGLGKGQQEVRDSCDRLARSMDKVLAKRAAEEPSAKAWNYVKVKATPVTVKQPGEAAIPPEKTVETVKTLLRNDFGSAWKAGIAQRTYALWARNAEEVAEKTGMYPPMPDAARSWDLFMKRADGERLKSAMKGQHWAQVDVNEGIDFAPVMNFRATFRSRPGIGNKPKMRM